MPNKLILKRSSTATAVPTAGQLEQGELAINIADEKLYSKNSSNVVFEIGGGAPVYGSALMRETWVFDSTVNVPQDPGSGEIRFSTGTASVTTGMYISDTTGSGEDPEEPLETLNGGHLIISNADRSSFLVYKVTAVTDNTTWWDLDVDYERGNGVMPTNGETLTVEMYNSPIIETGVEASSASDILYWEGASNRWEATGAQFRVNPNTPPTGGRLQLGTTLSSATNQPAISHEVGASSQVLRFVHQDTTLLTTTDGYYETAAFATGTDSITFGWRTSSVDYPLIYTDDTNEYRFESDMVWRIEEKTAPTSDVTNYGQIYIDSADAELYFRDEGGTVTQLSGVSGGASLPSATTEGELAVYDGTSAWRVPTGVFMEATATPPSTDEGYLRFLTSSTSDSLRPQMYWDALNTISTHYFARTGGSGATADGFYCQTHAAGESHTWGVTLSGVETELFEINESDQFKFFAATSVLFGEKTEAGADLAGWGQLWVKNDTPNTLWFTDDAGTDHQLGTGGGLNDVVDDLSPQLGGDLESNAFDIVMGDDDSIVLGDAVGGDATITWDGTASAIDIDVTTISTPLNFTGGIVFRLWSPDGTSAGLQMFADNVETYIQALGTSTSIRMSDDWRYFGSIIIEDAADLVFGADSDVTMTWDNGTTTWYQDFAAGTGRYEIREVTNPVFTIDMVNEQVECNDGYELRVYEPAGTDYIGILNDGASTRFSTNGGPYYFEDANLLLRDGSFFALYDSTNVHNVSFNHDGTDLNVQASASTVDLNLDDFTDVEVALHATAGGAFRVREGTQVKFSVLHTENEVQIRDGYDLVIHNASDDDTISISHNGTNAVFETNSTGGAHIFAHNGTNYMAIDPSDPEVRILNGATLKIDEVASAGTSDAGKGQIWVKNDAPNTLWFTDDAGTDHQLGTGGGSSANFFYKTADQTRNNTSVFVTDTHLQNMPLDADTRYRVTAYIPISTNTTADFKCSFNFSNTPQDHGDVVINGQSGNGSEWGDAQTSMAGTLIPVWTGTTGVGVITGYFRTNATTGGTFEFEWGQNTATAVNTTVKAGAWIKYEPID